MACLFSVCFCELDYTLSKVGLKVRADGALTSIYAQSELEL